MTRTDAVVILGAARQLIASGAIGIGKQLETGGAYVHLSCNRKGGALKMYRSMAETGYTPVIDCTGGGRSIEMYVEIGGNRIMCMLTPNDLKALRAVYPDIQVNEKEGYI